MGDFGTRICYIVVSWSSALEERILKQSDRESSILSFVLIVSAPKTQTLSSNQKNCSANEAAT